MTESDPLYPDPEEISPYLPPGTILGGFRIDSILGYGGFGITYEATDLGLQRRVVIKENFPQDVAQRDAKSKKLAPKTILDEEQFNWALKNFIREARILAALDHEAIVKVLSIFEDHGTAYFVMPFIDGFSLGYLMNHRLEKAQIFSQDEIIGLLSRLLRALRYLHGHNYFHRDIKPDNVMISKEGLPILIDFGSARIMNDAAPKTIIMSDGFSPPEQSFERGDHGPWSDLYALGALIHKILIGRPPVNASQRLIKDPMPKLTERAELEGLYHPEFLTTIDKALMPEIHKRYTSAQEWYLDLHPFLPKHTR